MKRLIEQFNYGLFQQNGRVYIEMVPLYTCRNKTVVGSLQEAKKQARIFQIKLDESHSHSRCMHCSAEPTKEVLWAEGMGHAWFCDKCFDVWKEEDGKDDICSLKAITNGEAAKKFAHNKNPNLMKEGDIF